MFRKKPAPDLIISAFTRVLDALWVAPVFREEHAQISYLMTIVRR
jgi:hypothetical protein